MMYYLGMNSGFGWVLMILFWVLIIWLVVTLIRGADNCGHHHNHEHYEHEHHDHEHHEHHQDHHQEASQSAVNLLQERYAKGEISESEYEEKKKVLNS